MFKVNNKDTRTTSSVPPKTSEVCRCRSGVYIVNFENISHLFVAFLLLKLNKQVFAGLPMLLNVSIISAPFIFYANN